MTSLMGSKATLHNARHVQTVPSLIKWTGSKRSQVMAIAQEIPAFRRYIEPFVGGGALLYLTAHNGAIASDLYRPLIELWQVVQREPHLLVADYRQQWSLLNEELNFLYSTGATSGGRLPEYYYQVRDRFNQTESPLDLNFIMRTCVNGIVRFNDKGEFNNSFHLSRRGMEPERFAKVVDQWHSVIQRVTFECRDYRESLAEAVAGDFVYLDPPYAGSTNRYISDLDTQEFFIELRRLSERGVKWSLSFDGHRGVHDLTYAVPRDLYKRHLLLDSGLSAVNKVLNGPMEGVRESLYLNY